MALITQAEFEQYTQIDFGNEPDTAVALWLDSASAAVESYCGRNFEFASGLVEQFDPRKYRSRIRVSRPPISTITSITEDGTALTPDQYFAYSQSGQIIRITGGHEMPWQARQVQGIVVTYDGGFSVIPDDVKLAVARIAYRIFTEGASFVAVPTGVQSVSIEDETVTYRNPQAASNLAAVGPDERTLLAPYVRRIG